MNTDITVEECEKCISKLEVELEESLKYDKLMNTLEFKELIIEGLLKEEPINLSMKLATEDKLTDSDEFEILSKIKSIKMIKSMIDSKIGNTKKIKEKIKEVNNLKNELISKEEER